MSKRSSEGQGFWLTTSRIQTLADGVFAIAMTLLILSLSLPDATEENGANLHSLLFGQADKFVNYFVSFLLLAVFWIIHHQQFHYIKRTDSRHLWINIAILMFVALIPFSTDLVGDYSGTTIAEMFFAGNLLVLGMLFLGNWVYATRRHRLVENDMSETVVVQGIRRNLIAPAISLVVIGLSVVIPEWSLWLYVSIPIILALPPFRRS